MATGLSAAEGLGTSQLRRFFLPGLIAAVGLHLYLPARLLHGLEGPYGVNSTVVFLVEVVLFGFLITSAIIPIFHLYEGFLLPWLTKPARFWNERKVFLLQEELHDLYANKSLDNMSSVEKEAIVKLEAFLSDFPVRQQDDSYTYEVERPTRLANIIATYELYTQRRYGVDGIFFWFHLVYLAPEASRDDFQENSVYAESVLLASAAGALVALVAGSVLVGLAVGNLFPRLAVFEISVSETTTAASMLFGLSAFAIFYRLSWPAHRALGKSFCALVDLTIPTFQDWASKAPAPPPDALKTRAQKLKRYLEVFDIESEPEDLPKESEKAVEKPSNQRV
jgi:hypothetical protein